jgi:hypothetical protein
MLGGPHAAVQWAEQQASRIRGIQAARVTPERRWGLEGRLSLSGLGVEGIDEGL